MRKQILTIIIILMAALSLASCSAGERADPVYDAPDRNTAIMSPTDATGLVTVKNTADGAVYLQFGALKLLPGFFQYEGFPRAMASMTILPGMAGEFYRCTLDWIEPLDEGVFSATALSAPAGDGLEIVLNSGYTCVEDGYLSIHYLTWWGEHPQHHDFTLFAPDPSNPFILELRQDSHSDAQDVYSDGLVCFDINGLPDTAGETITIQLNWTKPNGTKGTAYFGFKTRE